MKSSLLTVLALILTISLTLLAEDQKQDAPAKENPAKEAPAKETPVPAVLNFTMKSLAGEDVDLAKYQGKVILFVNTASKCGNTPQYAQLEALHEKYADKGLAILGFPSNNFGGQEPGTDKEIGEFCKQNYGVKFDMFAKVDVKGDNICPLYKYLTSKEANPDTAGDIRWNFDKFLVSREGKIIARFHPKTKPDAPEITQALEAELAK